MMRMDRVLVLVATLLMAFACSDDKSTSSDDPEDKVLVTATVGSAGGTLEADGIAVTIPAGALSADYTISVLEATAADPFGDYGASASYRIEGLPATVSQPLHLRVRYNTTLENGNYLAVGFADPDSVLAPPGR